MSKIKIFLLEDDKNHCQKYIDFVKSNSHLYQLRFSHGCQSGLKELERYQPDLILVDIELNKGDGTGLDFLVKLQDLELEKPPRIIVITNIEAPPIHDRAHRLGVDFIFEKNKPDYSPEIVINFAMDHLFCQKATYKPNVDSEESIRAAISQRLENMGVIARYNGKAYLIEGIAIAAKKHGVFDLKNDIYAPLSRKYSKSADAISKAIQTAIENAFLNTPDETMARYYFGEINSKNACPTPKEFITSVAEQFRF